ncbi:MFS transporter [Pseudonocardia nigra]|uniref:MFS transporter n=1 Tax=Pseudonocardia nigra TaxID=1921578 RepID=UPI001C602C20|nr:MFS transporter [Pseudonocardia nigra]
MTVQQAIDEIGYGRFQRRMLAVCGVTWAADAAEVLFIGFALPSIRAEFGLDDVTSGLLATVTFVGMLLGAWLWGAVADRIGRRSGFVLTVAIFAVFGLLSAFAPNVGWLLVLRLLTGFGLGGALPLDFALYAEYLPSRNRGRNLVILESFWAVGTVVAAGLAWVLVPVVGWRPLFATSALAALLVLWIRARIPESPRYLAVSGRADEAQDVIRAVAEYNGRPAPFAAIVAPPPSARVGVAALFSSSLRRSTVMLWLAWFGIALGYYGLFVWLPTVFVRQGFGFLQSYGYAFLLALAQLPGYFSAAWLIERWGRRPTIVAYLLLSAAGTFLFALAPGTGLLLAGGIAMSAFSLGAWGGLYAYTPELYPTVVRGTGFGAASGMSRIGGAIAPIIGGSLLAASLVAPLAVYAAAFVFAAVAVGLLGTETRGRSLTDLLPAAEGRS